MLKALRFSDCAIFTVPMEKISWIKHESGKGCFIPVGANLPTSGEANSRKGISTGGKLSVAVFSITGGKLGRWEIENIVEAVRFAASRVGNLRLIVVGRNAQDAEAKWKNRFFASPFKLTVLEVLLGEVLVGGFAFSYSLSLLGG